MSKVDIENYFKNKKMSENSFLKNEVNTEIKEAVKKLSEIDNNTPVTIKGINKLGTSFIVSGYLHFKKQNVPLVNEEVVCLSFTDKYNLKKIIGVYNFVDGNELTILGISTKNNEIYKNADAINIIERAKENGLLNLVNKLKKSEIEKHENLNAELSAYIANSNVGKPATVVNGMKYNYGIITAVNGSIVELKDGNIKLTDKISDGTMVYLGKPCVFNATTNKTSDSGMKK